MKKRPTKRELRRQLNDEIESYLNNGGVVHEFNRGESGLTDGRYSSQNPVFDQPKQERTDLKDVMQTLDARKSPAKKSPEKPPEPKMKVIYDDFGEPVRTVWSDS